MGRATFLIRVICGQAEWWQSDGRGEGTARSGRSEPQPGPSATGEAVPPAERGQAKLEALPKPSDESAALNKVYAAQQTQVNQLKAIANAVNAGDATNIQSISATLTSLGGPLNSQFGALGLTACGSGSSGN